MGGDGGDGSSGGFLDEQAAAIAEAMAEGGDEPRLPDTLDDGDLAGEASPRTAGTLVEVIGLQSKAAAQHNGKRATVLAFDARRYADKTETLVHTRPPTHETRQTRAPPLVKSDNAGVQGTVHG